MPEPSVKYGAHIFLWIEGWNSRQTGLLARVRELGLDCLEIAVGDDVEFDSHAIRHEADRQGVGIITSPGGHWPLDADLSHPGKDCRDAALQWHRQWIERSAEAGAVAYTGALYSHPGHVERRRPDPDEFRRAAENLHALAEAGRKCNVEIVLEPMSHFRVSLVNTPAQVMRLIEAADHPNLKVLLDTYHMVTEVRDFPAAIRQTASRLWGLHACESDRGCPGGGLIPWSSIARTLKDTGFKGHVLLETYNSSIRGGAFACSRGMFHDVCPDGDAFAKAGTAFLRNLLD